MFVRPALVRRSALSLLAVILAACSGADSNGTAPPPAPVVDPLVLHISPKVDTILLGTTKALNAVVTTSSGSPRNATITWSSADPSTASIADGKITALAAGSTTIYARSNSLSDSATIVVSSPELQLDISPSAVDAALGDTIDFEIRSMSASGAYANIQPANVRWHVSDTASAQILNGSLTTLKTGEVVVSAEVGTSMATASVKITQSPVNSISLTPSTASLVAGERTRLTATLYDSRGRVTSGEVTWSSSNTSVATVIGGTITAVGNGGAVITAKAGTRTASATINVSSRPASSVMLSWARDSMAVGRTMQVSATAFDAEGKPLAGRPVAYQSSNPSVATVNNTGLLNAIAAGASNISVIIDGIVTTKKLTVVTPVASSVTVSPATANVVVGAVASLTAQVKDQLGTVMNGQSVTWNSETPAIATVANGKVTGVSLGSAIIRASVGSLSASSVVTVQNVPVASVSVAPASASIEAGSTVALVVTSRDAAGNVLSNRTASFVSSATQIATVDGIGVVTGVSAGSATVTVTVEGKTATVNLTVTAPAPAPVASITYTLNSSSLNVGQTTAGVVHTYDANGVELTGRAVTFASLNPTIASVASNGTATALSGGTASISASSEGKVAYASLTVASSAVAVASVSVSAGWTTFSPGDTSTLRVVAKDAGGNILLGRTTTYATSNAKIVTVSSAGLVRGTSKGAASVSATVGGQVGSLGFTIVPDTATGTTAPQPAPVASVTVSLNSNALTVGQGTQANAVLRDAFNNVLSGTVTWSSSNTSVATVNSSGYVTTLGAGSATITATSGGVSGGAGVTVTAPVVTPTSVTVTLNSSSITVGQTTSAVATARDASNNVIPNISFTWTISPASGVASKSASTGSSISITGTGAGATSIVASVGSVTGSAPLNVTTPIVGPVALPLTPALLNFSQPAVTGKQWVVNAGDNLQNALNSAQRGDEIVIQAGATFTGNFVLPVKTGTSASGWITVRSSQLSSLPAGVRVGPANASSMPRILTPNADGAIKTAPGASGWWIAGLEVSLVPTATVNYGLVLIGDGSSAQNQASMIPSDIVLDRSYIHATSTLGTSRCVGLNSARTEVRESYLYDCHGKGFDTQAIGGWNGTGPYRIFNNMLAGAGENILFGGADPAIYGLVPSDIEIRRNYFYTPASWQGTWTKKNLLELKSARRVLIEGNVFDGSWADGQTGFGILLISANQSGGCTLCRVTDIMVRANLMKNVAGGFNLSGGQTVVDTTTRRLALIANVIDSLKYPNNNILLQILSNGHDLTIDSLVAVGGGGSVREFMVLDPDPAWTNMTFQNAVVEHGMYGMFSTKYTVGEASLGVVYGTKNYNNVSIIGPKQSGYPTSTFYSNESQVPLAAAIRNRVAAATAGVAIP